MEEQQHAAHNSYTNTARYAHINPHLTTSPRDPNILPVAAL